MRDRSDDSVPTGPGGGGSAPTSPGGPKPESLAPGLSPSVPRPPMPGAGANRFDDATRLLDPARSRNTVSAPAPAPAPGLPDRTVMVERPAATPAEPASPSTPIKTLGLSDPVVGWLVTVKGPALGRCHALGYGRNAIGRFREARVALMEDEQVSRVTVAYVDYDPASRRFLAGGGEAQTRAYVGAKPLTGTIALKPKDEIRIGQSVLRLVPVCGPDFDWLDLAGGSQRP